MDLQCGLTSPIEQRLGGSLLVGIEAFGGREQCEEGKRHDPIRPWNLHKQHGRKPTQTAGFDEMTLGGADRIAINAAGADLWSPTPLDGVIKPDHNRGITGYKSFDQ